MPVHQEILLESVMLLPRLLSRFSHVRLCATPQTAVHQAPPSLGFSRQEHCSGLPFPSPMHESEKWKWSRSVISNSLWPHGLQPTRLLHPWDFPGKSTGVGCHCLLWILYIENPKESIRKLLELISEFSKVAGYKINTQKLLPFLYTNNEKLEREIKESIPFTNSPLQQKELNI